MLLQDGSTLGFGASCRGLVSQSMVFEDHAMSPLAVLRRTLSAALAASLPLDAVRAAQSGLLADMNAVAAVIYGKDQS